MSRWETTSDESHLPGAPLAHRHLIEQTESGGCRLVNTIYLEGALAPLWRRIMGPAAARTLPTHSTPSSILLPGQLKLATPGGQPTGTITRVTESPTKHGFSFPSTSRVKRVTASHQPPPFSSIERISALARTLESTGTGAGKRILFQP